MTHEQFRSVVQLVAQAAGSRSISERSVNIWLREHRWRSRHVTQPLRPRTVPGSVRIYILNLVGRLYIPAWPAMGRPYACRGEGELNFRAAAAAASGGRRSR